MDQIMTLYQINKIVQIAHDDDSISDELYTRLHDRATLRNLQITQERCFRIEKMQNGPAVELEFDLFQEDIQPKIIIRKLTSMFNHYIETGVILTGTFLKEREPIELPKDPEVDAYVTNLVRQGLID